MLKNYAMAIKDDVETFEEYWIFLYEVLERDDLDKDWKRLKKANVTFIKDKAEWYKELMEHQHDMKHQFCALEELIARGEVTESQRYLDQLRESVLPVRRKV